MNEETIIEKRPTANGQQDTKKEGSAWKQVTLGGVSGILMGAGLLYAGQAVAQNVNSEGKPEETPEEKPEDVVAPEQGETSHTLENGLKVASVSDDLSFGEAFQQARAEVGPGGVFHWHGGIYNTAPEVHQAADTSADVQVVDQQTAQSSDQDADVHIVGYGEVEGHVAVGLDTNNDGQADVAIIDVDDSGNLSDPDVIVDNNGNMATYGHIANDPDPNLIASMENPDVAPDMPDYMNDAMIDA